jgi:transcriptional regulator with XRE-family HTH domain
MTTDLPTLGATIRAARLAAGIGLNAAARTFGVSGTYVCNIELGATAPTVALLQKMAALYGRAIDLDEWCRLAGRVPDDVDAILARPGAFERIRSAFRSPA